MTERVTRRSFINTATLAGAAIPANLMAMDPEASPQSAAAGSTAAFRIAVAGLVHPHAGDVLKMLSRARADIQVVGVSEPIKEVRADFVTKGVNRSEERRVGKECRSRWSPY